MAIVKLEMSEYEALKEQTEQLQDALKKQEELYKKIQDLEKAKLEAMEEAQQKVLVKTMLNHVNIDSVANELSYNLRTYLSVDSFEHWRDTVKRVNSYVYPGNLKDILSRSIINKQSTTKEFINLGNLELNLRKEIEESVKEELSNLNKVKDNLREKTLQCQEYSLENRELTRKLEKLEEENKRLVNENSSQALQVLRLNSKINHAKQTLNSSTFFFWGYKACIKDALSVLNSNNE